MKTTRRQNFIFAELGCPWGMQTSVALAQDSVATAASNHAPSAGELVQLKQTQLADCVNVSPSQSQIKTCPVLERNCIQTEKYRFDNYPVVKVATSKEKS